MGSSSAARGEQLGVRCLAQGHHIFPAGPRDQTGHLSVRSPRIRYTYWCWERGAQGINKYAGFETSQPFSTKGMKELMPDRRSAAFLVL